MAWDSICKSKRHWGVGLRKWQLIKKALGAKLVWEIYSNPTRLWVRILKAKYLESLEAIRV